MKISRIISLSIHQNSLRLFSGLHHKCSFFKVLQVSSFTCTMWQYPLLLLVRIRRNGFNKQKKRSNSHNFSFTFTGNPRTAGYKEKILNPLRQEGLGMIFTPEQVFSLLPLHLPWFLPFLPSVPTFSLLSSVII